MVFGVLLVQRQVNKLYFKEQHKRQKTRVEMELHCKFVAHLDTFCKCVCLLLEKKIIIFLFFLIFS